MIAKKELKKLEKSAVQLTLTIGKDDARKEYEALLKNYSKDAYIPGFRKGKVPVSVLELKYGEGLKAEAMQKIMDKGLQEVFETLEEKPLQFSPPEVIDENLKLDFDKDFTFTLKYDTLPTFKVANWKGIEIEEPQVTIGKADETRELEALQEQNSMVMDKASGKVAKNDIVTLNFVELDDAGNEIENTRRQDFVFTVGTGYNLYKFDDEIVGLTKDKEKIITKEYPADFEVAELKGTKKSLKVLVTAVKEKKLPELNDDLAQDISDEYKTLDDLKKAIKDRLEKAAASKVKAANLEAALAKIAEATPFDVPESMIRAELEQSWRSFASQSRLRPEQLTQMLGAEGKEKMLESWRPKSEVALKHRLIMEKIIEDEKITAPEDQVKAEIQKQADASKMTFEDTKDYFEKNDMMHYLEHDVKDRLLGDMILAAAKIKKGKKVTYLDLMEGKE